MSQHYTPRLYRSNVEKGEGGMGTPVADMREVPGGLFTMEHWQKIAVDLLSIVMETYSDEWKNDPILEDDRRKSWKSLVKPHTRQWAIEHLDYVEKQKRLAKERALAKLTYDDKIALGLPT